MYQAVSGINRLFVLVIAEKKFMASSYLKHSLLKAGQF